MNAYEAMQRPPTEDPEARAEEVVQLMLAADVVLTHFGVLQQEVAGRGRKRAQGGQLRHTLVVCGAGGVSVGVRGGAGGGGGGGGREKADGGMLCHVRLRCHRMADSVPCSMAWCHVLLPGAMLSQAASHPFPSRPVPSRPV
eukprot:364280-Chlamydomonas_euryale.AAC.24